MLESLHEKKMHEKEPRNSSVEDGKGTPNMRQDEDKSSNCLDNRTRE